MRSARKLKCRFSAQWFFWQKTNCNVICCRWLLAKPTYSSICSVNTNSMRVAFKNYTNCFCKLHQATVVSSTLRQSFVSWMFSRWPNWLWTLCLSTKLLEPAIEFNFSWNVQVAKRLLWNCRQKFWKFYIFFPSSERTSWQYLDWIHVKKIRSFFFNNLCSFLLLQWAHQNYFCFQERRQKKILKQQFFPFLREKLFFFEGDMIVLDVTYIG